MVKVSNVIRILLAVAIFSIIGITAVQAAGPSNQFVEQEQGTNERVYPALTFPKPGECGTNDPYISDMILQYNTYWGPRVDPDKVRWNSDLSWLRWYLPSRYIYPNGLSANGLSTTTTRVCIGSKGQIWAPNDLRLIYLWHK